jgi:hypothetical protein
MLRRYCTLVVAMLLGLIASPTAAVVETTPKGAPSADVTQAPAAPNSSTDPSKTPGPRPSLSASASSSAGPVIICSPTPPPGVAKSARAGKTVGPPATGSPTRPVQSACGTVPPPSTPSPGSRKSVADVATAFPGAEADSGKDAAADLVSQVPQDRPQARELLQQTSGLPRSLKKGWELPDTSGTVKLSVTRKGKVTKGHDAGPGFREYDGGEKGTRTVLQQLPGKNVRVYKIVEKHEAVAGAPTELRLGFDKGCKGGGLFSSQEKRCSTRFCTGGGFFSSKKKTCSKAWYLDDGYKYLGTRGVALINPNEHPDGFSEGRPMGFLTEPVARDANRKPISIDWGLNNNAIDITVHDNGPGIQYPVVVDPQWFVGRWLVKGALLRSNPEAAGVIMTLQCTVGAALDWPDTLGQPWYRRVWHAALSCLAAAL